MSKVTNNIIVYSKALNIDYKYKMYWSACIYNTLVSTIHDTTRHDLSDDVIDHFILICLFH